jgi:hypothetical protein
MPMHMPMLWRVVTAVDRIDIANNLGCRRPVVNHRAPSRQSIATMST